MKGHTKLLLAKQLLCLSQFYNVCFNNSAASFSTIFWSLLLHIQYFEILKIKISTMSALILIFQVAFKTKSEIKKFFVFYDECINKSRC